MAVKSRLKTYTYQYPDGKSFWTFRSEKIDGDEDEVQAMVNTTTQGKITGKELRQAKKQGTFEDLVLSKISTETKMSAKRAWLTHMSVACGGPECEVPEGYVQGEELGAPERDPATGEYIPHPLVGQTHPLTAEWVATHDPDELTEIFEELEDVWAGRSSEDEDSFPKEPARMDHHRAKQRGTAKSVPVSEPTE